MKKRKLGNANLDLTTVGLGTWAIGGPWEWGWGPQDDNASIATIHRALDLGVNWVDTAPAYGLGHAETVVGKALKGHRDEVLIATKCGRVWDDPASGKIYGRLKAASVRREAEASLRRLGVDYIDLYQVHWPQPDEDIEEAWTEVARLVEEGKVRYAGVSNFNVNQLKRAQQIHPIASLQPPYSMLVRGIETEVLPYCAAQGIGVIVYSPMQAGLLTGAFSKRRMTTLAPDDWRHKSVHFQEPALTENLAFVEQLRQIAAHADRSLAALAIAWVLRRPEVTAAIVGARHPDQLAEPVSGGVWELSPAEISALDALLAEHEEALSHL